jgi:hypothetical protein
VENKGGNEKKGLREAKVESSKAEAIMKTRIEFFFFWFEWRLSQAKMGIEMNVIF